MYCQSRLLLYKTVYQQADAQEDKRDAEPLSHIESHLTLKTDLRFLYELYQEAASETTDEEQADECSPVHLWKSVLIQEDQHNAQNQITEGLI